MVVEHRVQFGSDIEQATLGSDIDQPTHCNGKGEAKEAAEKRIAIKESLNEMTKQIFESKEPEEENLIEWNEPELDEVQTEIMRRFANRDTGRLSIGNLYDGVPFPRLIVDQAVRGLEEFGFLNRAMTSRSVIYTLTAEGTWL